MVVILPGYCTGIAREPYWNTWAQGHPQAILRQYVGNAQAISLQSAPSKI